VNIIPILDRILVKPIEESDITKGGLMLVQFDKKKPSEGEVLAVGPGRMDENGKRKPLTIKKGDVVYYKGDYTGVPLEHDGKKFLMMKEEDIIGVRE
jgi:chaperonin GroES